MPKKSKYDTSASLLFANRRTDMMDKKIPLTAKQRIEQRQSEAQSATTKLRFNMMSKNRKRVADGVYSASSSASSSASPILPDVENRKARATFALSLIKGYDRTGAKWASYAGRPLDEGAFIQEALANPDPEWATKQSAEFRRWDTAQMQARGNRANPVKVENIPQPLSSAPNPKPSPKMGRKRAKKDPFSAAAKADVFGLLGVTYVSKSMRPLYNGEALPDGRKKSRYIKTTRKDTTQVLENIRKPTQAGMAPGLVRGHWVRPHMRNNWARGSTPPTLQGYQYAGGHIPWNKGTKGMGYKRR